MKRKNFDVSWKTKNSIYLCELQKFLDKVDNIENEALKQDIIYQMLRCDDALTTLSHEMFDYYYKKGLQEQKRNFLIRIITYTNV